MKAQQHEKYVVFNSDGSNPPLFWVLPYFIQSEVIKGFGREQRVYGLRWLYSDQNAPPTIDQVAARYVELIRDLQPRGPYALTGYCIAGAVAREVARQLQMQGEVVDPLILIDPPDPGQCAAALIRDPLWFRLRFAANRLLFHVNKTRRLNSRDQLAYFKKSMSQARKRMADRLNQFVYRSRARRGEPLPQQMQDSYNSSVQAFLNSAPKPYAGRAILLRPVDKPQHAFDYANRRWAQLITGGLEIHEVPGDGTSMWRGPNAEAMSGKIIHFLLKAADTVGTHEPSIT